MICFFGRGVVHLGQVTTVVCINLTANNKGQDINYWLFGVGWQWAYSVEVRLGCSARRRSPGGAPVQTRPL